MKTGRTHFYKNSSNLSFQDISKTFLSDLDKSSRYLEKKFHQNLTAQFSDSVNKLIRFSIPHILKTIRKTALQKNVIKPLVILNKYPNPHNDIWCSF